MALPKHLRAMLSFYSCIYRYAVILIYAAIENLEAASSNALDLSARSKA